MANRKFIVGNSLVKPLSGSRKGEVGLVVEYLPGGRRYRVGFPDCETRLYEAEELEGLKFVVPAESKGGKVS